MTAHAILGASSAYRWMSCPGSIKLSEDAPRQPSSTAALEGTSAHHLCEVCLKNYEDPEDFLNWRIHPDGDLFKPGDAATPVDTFLVDEVMVDAVRTYVDAVNKSRTEIEELMALEGLTPEVRVGVEMQFDLSFVRPNMFGTNDASVFGRGVRLDVHDFKYGKGHVVEVENNVQMMYYALGAIREACWDKKKGDWKRDALPETVRLIVTQPRAPHKNGPVRSWEFPIADLFKFQETLKAAADATAIPNAELNAGNWCFFCPAKPLCPELRSGVKEALATDFDDLDDDELTLETGVKLAKDVMADPTQLAKALKAAPMVDAFLRAIEAHALDELKAGNSVPGFKLVRKGSRRKWKDEAEALEALSNFMEEEQLLQPRKIKSFTQIEKIDKDAAMMVKGLTEKPEGGLTIAEDSDVRSAISSGLQEDFKDL